MPQTVPMSARVSVQTLSRNDADIQLPDGAREFVRNEEDANGSWSSVHKLDGQVILASFYQRDIPMLRQEMRNGKVHGRHVEYDDTGQPIFVEHYRDGLPHGPIYQWSRDGALIHQGVFDSGTGVDIYCQYDGKLSETACVTGRSAGGQVTQKSTKRSGVRRDGSTESRDNGPMDRSDPAILASSSTASRSNERSMRLRQA